MTWVIYITLSIEKNISGGSEGPHNLERWVRDHPPRRHGLWKVKSAKSPFSSLLQLLMGIRCGVWTVGWTDGKTYPRSQLCSQGPAVSNKSHCVERNICRTTRQKSCKPSSFILTWCLIRVTTSLPYEGTNENPRIKTAQPNSQHSNLEVLAPTTREHRDEISQLQLSTASFNYSHPPSGYWTFELIIWNLCNTQFSGLISKRRHWAMSR